MKKLLMSFTLWLTLICTSNAQWYIPAEKFFYETQYDSALNYYLRSKVDAELVPDTLDINLRIIQCNNRTGNHSKAYQLATNQPYTLIPTSNHQKYRYEAALAAYMLNKYKDAYFQLIQLQYKHPDSTLHLTTLQLKTMVAIQLQDSTTAIKLIQLISKDTLAISPEHVSALIRQISTTKYLNLKTANWLAMFLPGSGLIYAGNIKEGITSTAITLACISLTTLAAYSQMYITGYAYGLTALQQFYFGGIRRTAYIVNTENNARKRLLIQQFLTFTTF